MSIPKFLLIMAVIFFIIGFLVTSVADALRREDEMNDQIRLDRCAAFGEKLPEELQGYCKGE